MHSPLPVKGSLLQLAVLPSRRPQPDAAFVPPEQRCRSDAAERQPGAGRATTGAGCATTRGPAERPVIGAGHGRGPCMYEMQGPRSADPVRLAACPGELGRWGKQRIPCPSRPPPVQDTRSGPGCPAPPPNPGAVARGPSEFPPRFPRSRPPPPPWDSAPAATDFALAGRPDFSRPPSSYPVNAEVSLCILKALSEALRTFSAGLRVSPGPSKPLPSGTRFRW
jgi:hypothetical protein